MNFSARKMLYLNLIMNKVVSYTEITTSLTLDDGMDIIEAMQLKAVAQGDLVWDEGSD